MVLRDWADDQAIAILRNCRSAATGGGRALVVGTVIGEIGKPDLATLSDMDMLCVTEASSGTWPSSTDCRRIRMAPRRGLSRRGEATTAWNSTLADRCAPWRLRRTAQHPPAMTSARR